MLCAFRAIALVSLYRIDLCLRLIAAVSVARREDSENTHYNSLGTLFVAKSGQVVAK